MINRIAEGYAIMLRKTGQHPAAIVFASYNWYNKKGRSGPPPTPLVKKLELKLLSIGPLGARISGNKIGYCAEVHASNKLLSDAPGISLNRIEFGEAIRPRTMQKIAMCANCNKTFS